MDPGLLSNRYQIVRRIGTGDTTSVLHAWDRRANRHVAVKVPIGQLANDKAFLLRLERTVAALAGFSHPNVAAVHAVERGGGAGFVVVEMVDGASLGDLLAGRGPLPPAQAARLAATVGAALAAAHARGIVHGHLTLANVLLAVDGRVKVTDFRLARAAQPLAGAPDPAGDLRALGRLLAAMLTGREPAAGEPVRLDPTVPPGLAAIVARAADPVDPYRSAAEVGRDLDRFLATASPDAAPAGRRDMSVADDATGVLAAVVASPAADPAADLVAWSAGPPRLSVARGVASSSGRRRRGLPVAAGLVGASLVVGAVAGVKLLGGGPGGAAVVVGQATVAPPPTVVRATTTSRPQPATSSSAATSTVTSRVSTTTAPPTIAPPPAAAGTSPPTTSTGRLVGPGQRIVPNVVGLRPRQAAHMLAQAQLGMQSLLVQVRDPGQVRRVIAQQPPAGQVVPAGSGVTVLVGTIRPTSL